MQIVNAPNLTESHYIEIPQANPLRFSLVRKEKDQLIRLSYPFKCRDFYGDYIYNSKNNITGKIYGFTADGTEPLNLNKTELLLYNYRGSSMYCIRALLRDVFKINIRYKQEELEESLLLCYIETDKLFVSNASLASLFTLLLRMYNTNAFIPSYTLKDFKYYNQYVDDSSTKNYIDAINNPEFLYDILHNPEKYDERILVNASPKEEVSIYDIHNRTGIVAAKHYYDVHYA